MHAKAAFVSSWIAALLVMGCGATQPTTSTAAPTTAEATAGSTNEAATTEEKPDADSTAASEAPGDHGGDPGGEASACGACEDEPCVAKCEALCDKKDKEACAAVVDHYSGLAHNLSGTEADAKDPAATSAASKKLDLAKSKELKYAKLGCDAGSGHACERYGSLAWSGQAGEVSDKKFAISFAAFKKACELEDMSGCDGLARSYLGGDGTPKDAGKAADAWGLSCLKSRYGCGELKKLIAAKNKRALVALDTIKKECAKLDPKAMFQTACDAQKELEKK